MMKNILLVFIAMISPVFAECQMLKSVVYDFDGLDIGRTNLPEGDYRNYDVTYKIAENPLAASDMIGDRVLQIDLRWSAGKGQFGKSINRFIEMNAALDRLNFYFYNPTSNKNSVTIDVIISEDDDKNNLPDNTKDDYWKRRVVITRQGSWQLVSLPLNSFVDNNVGKGNGVFDAAFTNEAGRIFKVEFNIVKTNSAETTARYYIDMICFSEGALPTGSTIMQLPPKQAGDHCVLGAFVSNDAPQTTPAAIEGLFTPQKKLKYINWFVGFSNNGTTVPSQFTGSEVTQLLQGGYRPIITWEPMYLHLARLDPAQPRLQNIINGEFDSYIDKFADKIKSYNDTVIIRFMHEMEGNWYPWSLVHNGQDPNRYIAAFRKVVDRFRARGATKVKWMWCINSSYSPVAAYNFAVRCYPGDNYVDYVATDLYNRTLSGIPDWRSFREGSAESYYYLVKYFPHKKLIICENGCRERYSSENPASQTKAQWVEYMDKELQSNFHKARALVFFSKNKTQDYRVNSSTAAKNAYQTHIWTDNYYWPSTFSLRESNDSTNACDPSSRLVAGITVADTNALCKVDTIRLSAPRCENYVYQWRKNGVVIPRAVHADHIASSPGEYRVKIIRGSSIAWSAPVRIIAGNCNDTLDAAAITGINEAERGEEDSLLVKVFPNPNSGLFILEISLEASNEEIVVEVLNPVSQPVYTRSLMAPGGFVTETIEMDSAISTGIYILRITVGNQVESTRLVLTR